jgi:60 kDa SS-A/Ro ribonucleoprotein
MIHAAKHSIPVDTFVVYTDSETWFGGVHPAEALRRYREKMGIAARLIVCGMVANRFTIADPDDPGMLDVVGFDTRAPALMAEFSLGRLD